MTPAEKNPSLICFTVGFSSLSLDIENHKTNFFNYKRLKIRVSLAFQHETHIEFIIFAGIPDIEYIGIMIMQYTNNCLDGSIIPSSMLTLRTIKSSLQYIYLDKDERLKWAHFEDVSSIEHKEGILTVLIRGSWLFRMAQL